MEAKQTTSSWNNAVKLFPYILNLDRGVPFRGAPFRGVPYFASKATDYLPNPRAGHMELDT